jgi:ParB/RepB/Spo0J family partition protein
VEPGVEVRKSKEMEYFMERIKVKELVYESNRRYGKDLTFEQLKESIREYGILEPPLVREEEAGRYRVIAGRRRVQAAAELGLEAVDCMVRRDDADDEELALVENINRLEMHPLEEAEIFCRMKAAGAAVGSIASAFARSPQAIAQRIRLGGLNGGGREMFREGRLEIKGAVVLAGLPEEDQEAFCKRYEGKKATVWEVQEYITRTRKCRLYPLFEGTCEACKERTRNGEKGLFEEEYDFDDVCLNPACYKRKWDGLIAGALREAEEGGQDRKEAGKIGFDESIPPYLYEKDGEFAGDGTRYEVLRKKRYLLCREETKRKTNVYWRVSYREGRIQVKRCGYEKREAHEKAEARENAKGAVKAYGEAVLRAAGERLGETPEALAGALRERKINQYEVKRAIEKRMWRRVAEGNLARQETRNYAGMYLSHVAEDDEEKDLEKYSGFKTFEQVNVEWRAQRLFHFLVSREVRYNLRVPTVEDLADPGKKYREELFWKYAGMEEETYRTLYLEEGRKVVEHLKNGGSIKALKKEAPGAFAPEAPGAEESGP